MNATVTVPGTDMDLQPKLKSIQTRVDGLRPLPYFLAIFVPLLALFFITSSRGHPFPYNIDARANALTAWKLGTHGTFYLDEYSEFTGDEFYGKTMWLLSTENHTVSKYPPGTAALAAPAYFLAQSELELVRLPFIDQKTQEWSTAEIALPSLNPAAFTASLVTAAAIGFLGLVFRSLAAPWMALLAAYLAGLGTSAWSVASDILMQHGPAMMFIAIALVMMQRGWYVPAGLAFGFAVLVRPQTAIIAAIAGIITARHLRSWKPVLQVGAASSIGLGLYLMYNRVVFGSAGPIPEPAGYFAAGLRDSPILKTVGDLFLAFFDPVRGMLPWSPFLLILLPGLRAAWRVAPGWARGAAVGGILSFVVQIRGNGFAGGSAFFSYRYPLEMLTAAAPLLLLAYREWVARTSILIRIFPWTAIGSIAIHALGAIAG